MPADPSCVVHVGTGRLIACVHMTPLRASRLTFCDLEVGRLCTNALQTDASVMLKQHRRRERGLGHFLHNPLQRR
jgi:hypothetical protein